MTIRLNDDLHEAVAEFARADGRDVEAIVADAIREYLVAVSITDVNPAQVAETQEQMLHELKPLTGTVSN